jgi:hypothetical protein
MPRRFRVPAHFAILVGFGFGVLVQTASAQTADTTFQVANGTVYSTARDGNTIYLCGDFTQFGPPIGSVAAIDGTSGAVLKPWARVDGTIRAVIPDGSGGWYIGGDFTHVQGVFRNHVARIDASGNVTLWNPGTDGSVQTLDLDVGTVYIGGSFLHIGGVARSNIGAVDASTAAVTGWTPNANNTVNSIIVHGDFVYVGGAFTAVGGQSRSRIAALAIFNGLATTWNPGANGIVSDLAMNGRTLYTAGAFTTLGGLPRNRIAAVDSVTGVPTSWDPDSDGNVVSLAVNGGIVYAGGTFTTIGGQTRTNLAALSASTGLATSWNPAPNLGVNVLHVNAGTLYAGGSFTSIAGQTRNRIAALDVATGNLTAWNPNANNTALTIATHGGTVCVGGTLSSFGGQIRNRLAAFDATTWQLTAWDPNANNTVIAIAMDGHTVYAGGNFTNVGGQPRSRIAAVDAVTGAVTAWNPNASGSGVHSLAVFGNILYTGGLFANIGGQPRNNLAALDLTTGNATAWNPDMDGGVYALTLQRDVLYAGGAFMAVGGSSSRWFAAAFNTGTGALTSWNPNLSGSVNTIAATWGTVYLGGVFTTVGGTPRSRIAAVDPTGGGLFSWNPNASSNVDVITVVGTTVYTGGFFDHIGGQPRFCAAGLDPSATATGWDPNATSDVRSLRAVNGQILLGGLFRGMSSFAQQGIAKTSQPAPIAPFSPTPTTLLPVSTGSAAWGDYDNDDDLDILVNGWPGAPDIARVQRNEGSSNATFPDAALGIPGTELGQSVWGDYDNDGDLDFVITGTQGADGLTRIYRNSGGANPTFVDIAAGLPGVFSGMAAWGDYDNDGDLDLALTGQGSPSRITKLFRNSGGANPTFAEVAAGLTAASGSTVAWADYDNDGDLDLLLTGYNGSASITKLYRNGGGVNPVFTETPVGFENVSSGATAWGDYDNDGDLDLFLGGTGGSGSVNHLYRNSGGANPTFADVVPGFAPGPSVAYAWGDYDNDGNLDLGLIGGPSIAPVTKVYRNTGGANPGFIDMPLGLPGVVNGSIAWGDYDRDGRLDLLFTGQSSSGKLSEVLHNESPTANTPPLPPDILYVSFNGSRATFHWYPASDAQTPTAALSYNLRVGTTPGACDIVSPMAASTGTRRVPQLGNAQLLTSREITLPGSPPWYWSVQAIDGAFAGSAWSPERTISTVDVASDRPLERAVWIDGANPSRSGPRIGFSIPQREAVSIGVYDVTGRRLRRLVAGTFEPGRHSVPWNGSDDRGESVGPGLYFVRFEAGGVVQTRKLTRFE